MILGDWMNQMLYVFLVMLISSAIFMYVFMLFNDVWNKAALYDYYKPLINEFEKCLPYKPTCICPTRDLKWEDINIFAFIVRKNFTILMIVEIINVIYVKFLIWKRWECEIQHNNNHNNNFAYHFDFYSSYWLWFFECVLDLEIKCFIILNKKYKLIIPPIR